MVVPVNQVSQFIPGIWIKEIERIIFQCGVDSRFLSQDTATFRERSVVYRLNSMEQRHLCLEFPFQSLLRVLGQFSLRQEKSQSRDRENDEHHRAKQLGSECHLTSCRIRP